MEELIYFPTLQSISFVGVYLREQDGGMALDNDCTHRVIV